MVTNYTTGHHGRRMRSNIWTV